MRTEDLDTWHGMQPGSDDALRAILTGQDALVCTRDWSAWGYKTMRESDFASIADDPDCVAEFTAWRDAAVERFRTALVEHIREAGPQVLGRYSNETVALLADVVSDFVPEG